MSKQKHDSEITNPLHMPFDKAIRRVAEVGPYPAKSKPTPKRPPKKPKKLGRRRTNRAARQSEKPTS
jgi:hypothetical protein